MILTLGIIFAIIAMIGFGLSNAIMQIPTKNIGSERTIFYRGIITSFVLLIIFFIVNTEFNYNIKDLGIGILIGLLGYLPLFCFSKALKYEKVGIVSPIAGSYVLFGVIFSFFLYGEKLTSLQSIAIFFILIGISLISINLKDLKNIRISKGIVYALFALVLWGLFISVLKFSVIALGAILASLFVELTQTIIAAINIKLNNKKFKIKNKEMDGILGTGISAIIASIFYSLALKYTSVGIVAGITAASPIIATTYGKIFFKEKLIKQQYLAIIIIIFGVIILSI